MISNRINQKINFSYLNLKNQQAKMKKNKKLMQNY